MSTPGQSTSETPPTNGEKTTEGSKPETLPPARRRDPRYRTALLEKLPSLGFTSWSAREDFKPDEDWAGIVSLRSDSVLGPLEPLARERPGE